MKTQRKIVTTIVGFLLLTGINIYSQEIRGGMGVEYSPGKFEVDVGFDTRHISALYDEQKYIGQVKVTYPLLEQFSISGSFRYCTHTEREFDEGIIGIETTEKNRLAFDVQYKSERFNNDVRISNRFRYQFGHWDGEIENTAIRNKLVVDYKMSKVYSPYVAGEIYYNPEHERIKSYRFYMGNTVEIQDVEIDLFYIVEKKMKELKSGSYYILGLALKYRL